MISIYDESIIVILKIFEILLVEDLLEFLSFTPRWYTSMEYCVLRARIILDIDDSQSEHLIYKITSFILEKSIIYLYLK